MLKNELADNFYKIATELAANSEQVATSNAQLAADLGVDLTDAPVLYGDSTFVAMAADSVEHIKAAVSKVSTDNITDVAHPEPVFVAEAPKEGGLVENGNEQQRKMIDIATKMPFGAPLMGVASVVQDFFKVADDLRAQGLHKQAAQLEALADETVSYVESVKKKL